MPEKQHNCICDPDAAKASFARGTYRMDNVYDDNVPRFTIQYWWKSTHGLFQEASANTGKWEVHGKPGKGGILC